MSTRLEEYENAPEVTGTIVYSKDWYLLTLPKTFHDMLVEMVNRTGEDFTPNQNPHISVMKNEAPSQNKADWGVLFVGDTVSVKYSMTIRNDNGFHFWIDCYSPILCQMREHFALPTLKTSSGIYLVNFHTTIGKRKNPVQPNLREQYRLTPQSHIDVETGMQHL